MDFLSRAEEIVLLAIWQLQDNAYGVTIRNRIKEATGKLWSIGAIYAPLHRLQNKGYVSTSQGDPVAERGGRRKVLYAVTEIGKQAMAESKRVHESLWRDAPSLGL